MPSNLPKLLKKSKKNPLLKCLQRVIMKHKEHNLGCRDWRPRYSTIYLLWTLENTKILQQKKSYLPLVWITTTTINNLLFRILSQRPFRGNRQGNWSSSSNQSFPLATKMTHTSICLMLRISLRLRETRRFLAFMGAKKMLTAEYKIITLSQMILMAIHRIYNNNSQKTKRILLEVWESSKPRVRLQPTSPVTNSKHNKKKTAWEISYHLK